MEFPSNGVGRRAAAETERIRLRKRGRPAEAEPQTDAVPKRPYEASDRVEAGSAAIRLDLLTDATRTNAFPAEAAAANAAPSEAAGSLFGVGAPAVRTSARDPRITVQLKAAEANVRGTLAEQAAARAVCEKYQDRPDAKHLLARMYWRGIGGEAKPAVARQLLAEIDTPLAKADLGLLMHAGVGGARDIRQAIALLEAAKIGSSELKLASIYSEGSHDNGCADRRKAEYHFNKAHCLVADELRKLGTAAPPGLKLQMVQIILKRGNPVEARRLGRETALELPDWQRSPSECGMLAWEAGRPIVVGDSARPASPAQAPAPNGPRASRSRADASHSGADVPHSLVNATLQVLGDPLVPAAARRSQLHALLQCVGPAIPLPDTSFRRLFVLAAPLATDAEQRATLFEKFAEAAARIN